MKEESLSKPLFQKKLSGKKPVPKKTTEILKEIASGSTAPKGNPNYWGNDKSAWKKKS